MALTTSAYPYRREPMNNVVPFTNGNGTTTLQILERLIYHLNHSVIPSVNDALGTVSDEYQRLYDEAKAYVDAQVGSMEENDAILRRYVVDSVQAINNRVGAPEIQRFTLIGDTFINVDPTLPDNHVLHYTVTQDSVGGRKVSFHSDIDAEDFQLDPAPGSATVFSLIPLGNEKFKLIQLYSTVPGGSNDTSLATLIAAEDTLTGIAVREIVTGGDSDVRADLVAALHDLAESLRAEVPGLASDAVDSDGELRESVKSAARAALTDVLNGPQTAERDLFGVVAREAVNDSFNGLLRPWGQALADTSQAPAVWVALGGSTTAGQGYAKTGGYVGRIAAYLSRRSTVDNVVRTLDSTTTRPANGVHVYEGIGGDTTNYLNAARIAAIGVLRPQIITHMIGANDYAAQTNLDTYKANIREWVRQIKNVSPNTTHMFIHQHGRTDVANPVLKWSAYGKALKEIAAEVGGLYVDVSAVFGPRIPDAYMLSDGVNVNIAGHAVIADVVSKAMGIRMPIVPNEIVIGAFKASAVVPTNVVTTIASGTVNASPFLRIGKLSCSVFAYGAATFGQQGPEWGLIAEYADGAREKVRANRRVRILQGGAGSALTQYSEMLLHIEPNRAVNFYCEIHSINSESAFSSNDGYSTMEMFLTAG